MYHALPDRIENYGKYQKQMVATPQGFELTEAGKKRHGHLKWKEVDGLYRIVK